MNLALTPADWLDWLLHFMLLSLLAVGGPMSTAPGMHGYLVQQRHWLTDAQFTSSIALGQAAPGPNILFVALLGWNVGINAAGGMQAGWHAMALGLLGLALAMTGTMLPSLLLNYQIAAWLHRNQQHLAVRAFKTGMAPIVIAMLLSTGWLLIAAHHDATRDWPLWLLAAVATLAVWRTRIHILWLIGAGAVAGAAGWV